MDEYRLPRQRMVERLHDHYGIRDGRVLDAMFAVQRHLFVPEALRPNAYGDHALPIAANQTISQPFIVARMTELLGLDKSRRVLEIGAGSGYQTAILAHLAKEVYAVERVAELADESERRLRQMGFRNILMRCADGTRGWGAGAPYDAVLVAAGGPEIPEPLLQQLKVNGKMVIPVGDTRESQKLIRATRGAADFKFEEMGACAFVPLIGEHGWAN